MHLVKKGQFLTLWCELLAYNLDSLISLFFPYVDFLSQWVLCSEDERREKVVEERASRRIHPSLIICRITSILSP